MKTVLAAVDFSPVTNRIADSAITLARLINGRVVFVHAVPPPAAIRDALPAIEDGELRAKSSGRAAERKLAKLKLAAHRKFPAIEVSRLAGPPVACILEEAQRRGAEYIVIGSHGRSTIYDALIGGVASGVIKNAPCPVLVLPPVTALVGEAKQPLRESTAA